MTQTKVKPPIVPRSASDPLGVERKINAAENEFKRRFAEIARLAKELYSAPLEESAVLIRVVNKTYEFTLDPERLKTLNNELHDIVDRVLLEGGADNLWLVHDYVATAYQAGTAQQLANLSAQSSIYAASRPSIVELIAQPAYQRRIGYLHARVFEDMQGMTTDVVKSVSRILSDGMAQGRNPRELAQSIADAVGSELYRGERIARTEIGQAMRTARMDEADQATREFGIKSKEMHVSAFSPTTRPSHAQRSGKVFTREEQREWWSVGANAINCKCTTISVLVDENDNPLAPSVIERAGVIKEKMLKKYPQLDG